VDTPPFNLYPDAQVISAVVGRAMTLHRSASSNYKDTRSMLRSLAISHVEVIGGVLNRV
jgi:Mrp family chromosome partitioning ATPase